MQRDARSQRHAIGPDAPIKFFGLGCIFAVHWTVAKVRPGTLQAIETFCLARSMLASIAHICATRAGAMYKTA